MKYTLPKLLLYLKFLYTPLILYGILFWHFLLWNSLFIGIGIVFFLLELIIFSKVIKPRIMKAEIVYNNWEKDTCLRYKQKNIKLYLLVFLTYNIINAVLLDKIFFDGIYNYEDNLISIIITSIAFILFNITIIIYAFKNNLIFPMSLILHYKKVYIIDVKTEENNYFKNVIFLSKEKIENWDQLIKDLSSGKKEIKKFLSFRIIENKN